MHIIDFLLQYGRTVRAFVAHGDKLQNDWYTRNILVGAMELNKLGRNDWEYQSQYTSGACFWVSQIGGKVCKTSEVTCEVDDYPLG